MICSSLLSSSYVPFNPLAFGIIQSFSSSNVTLVFFSVVYHPPPRSRFFFSTITPGVRSIREAPAAQHAIACTDNYYSGGAASLLDESARKGVSLAYLAFGLEARRLGVTVEQV